MLSTATPLSGPRRERIVVSAAAIVVAISLGGLAAISWAVRVGIAEIRPARANIFWVLLARNETVFFALLGLGALAAAVVFRTGGEGGSEPRATDGPADALAVGVLCVLAFVTSWWGQSAVLWSLPFSMDEYGPAFQSEVFQAHRLEAAVPDAWLPFEPALRPLWIRFDAASRGWASEYLPGFALLQALFGAAGLRDLTNPSLAAGGVFAVYLAARRLWPADRSIPLVAALLLATSAQFLVTSMSWYSMPAHLFANALWVACAFSSGRFARAATPWIGGFSMLLHQPIPHALFAAPFLLRLLRERRFARLAYWGIVYAGFAAAGLAWLRFASSQWSGGNVFRRFEIPTGVLPAFLHAANAALLLAWQSPLLPFLLAVSALSFRRLRPAERDLLAGVVLTFATYVLFPSDQGHGWGYRYAYGVLGNVVLLGALGWRLVASGRRDRRAFAAAACFGVAVLLPLRFFQCREFVEPFARAFAYVRSAPVDVLIVDPLASWYGLDLVRNAPFLRESPKVLAATAMTEPMRAALERRHPGRIATLRPEETAALGVPSWRVQWLNDEYGRRRFVVWPLAAPPKTSAPNPE